MLTRSEWRRREERATLPEIPERGTFEPLLDLVAETPTEAIKKGMEAKATGRGRRRVKKQVQVPGKMPVQQREKGAARVRRRAVTKMEQLESELWAAWLDHCGWC